MSVLNELTQACSDVTSDRILVRNRAIEKLDCLLNSSKDELISLYSRPVKPSPSWNRVFLNVVNAVEAHSMKVFETRGSKGYQTALNRNHIYSSVMNKILDYSIEANNNSLAKKEVIDSFNNLYRNQIVVSNFRKLILRILERGIFDVAENRMTLIICDISEILLSLFECNVPIENDHKVVVLRLINKTIEISQQQLPASCEYKDHFSKIALFANNAEDEAMKGEVIKMFCLFTKEFLVDYHIMVCTEIQQTLPTLCSLYTFHLRPEIKTNFFNGIYWALKSIYPNLHRGDCNPIGTILCGDWMSTMHKVMTIMEVEAKQRSIQIQNSVNLINDPGFEYFVKVSAMVIYVIHWANSDFFQEGSSRAKISRTTDYLEIILGSVTKDNTMILNIRLEIFTQLINMQPQVINLSNYISIVDAYQRFFLMSNWWQNIRCLRLGVNIVLHVENKLSTLIRVENEKWAKIVEILITDTTNDCAILKEKHLLLQMFIKFNKLSAKVCTTFLNFLLVNNSMRRNECIATVREIMRYHENCGLNKTSDIVVKLLNWLYANNKIDGRNLLLCIDPLDQGLIADTSALMVINFLDTAIVKPAIEKSFQPEEEEATKHINYRYCRKYMCIEVYGKELKECKTPLKEKLARCLIQSNYDLLMRLLNYEITNISVLADINIELSRLLKIVYSLRTFFNYNIFDENTYITCPLIKRIGLFIDNIDFQLRSIIIPQASKSELTETLELMLEIFLTICGCSPFLNFLTKRSLDGLISFIGSSLKFSGTIKSDESKKISLVAVKLLATLCSSHTHWQNSFSYIHNFKLFSRLNTLEVLNIIKLFCQQKSNENIAHYFMSKVESICTHHCKNIEISSEVIRMIPEIARYVEPFPELLNSVIVAVSSFLKLCSIHRYPIYLIVKIIDSVRYIARYCPNLIVEEDFAITCLDIVYFIQSPYNLIAFATITTITALLDINWTAVDDSKMGKYFEFCQEIYSKMNLDTLPIECDDIKSNTVGIIVQLLISLFTFSYFHREEAFKEVGRHCADLKIDEIYFQPMTEVAAFNNYSLNDLTKPYVESLISVWCEKKQPMLRFPYYLCSESREKFIKSNLLTISYYQLRFHPKGIEELHRLKYGTKQDLIMNTLPICYAYLLSLLSGSVNHPSDNYKEEANQLMHILKTEGIDVTTTSNKPHWMTLYNIIKLLWDNIYFKEMFGIDMFILTPALSVDTTVMHKYLQFYLNKCYSNTGNNDECFLNLMKNDPMSLSNVLAAFKTDIYISLSVPDKIKAFYWFCSLADNIVHSISRLVPVSSLSNTHIFFLQDILFFLLNIISNPKADYFILNPGLHFINYFLDIPTFRSIINKHLNKIVCILVTITDRMSKVDTKPVTIVILEKIICRHTEDFYHSIKLLAKFPDMIIYEHLRKIQQMVKNKITDLRTIVQDFLDSHTKGSVSIKSLRQTISEKKSELESLSNPMEIPSNFLYDLLKQLIDIVRGDDETLAVEAGKCLGEISAIKIKNVSFYFECDTTFYNMESVYQNEMDFFAESFYMVLNKSLLNYDPPSHVALYAVCKDLTNSTIGSRILDSFPIFSVFRDQRQASILDSYSLIAPFSFVDLVKEYEMNPYETWVKAFSSKLFKLCQWDSFSTLCQLNFSFSESSIIPVFKMFLASSQKHLDNIILMLQYFFMRTFETIRNEEWKTIRSIYSDKRVIKYFLNICECIRIHNNWNVPIDLLHVAEACIYCQAYFMGILYSEMWALTERDKGTSKNSDIVRNEIFQNIATQAFKSIHCTEAISGFLNPCTSRLEYLSLDGDWSQVLLELDSSKELNKNLYVQNLKRNGLLSLCCDKFSENIDYECCWRLGQWDTPVETNSKLSSLNDLEYEFEKNHFLALKSIFNREEVHCISAIHKARYAVISILKEISVECLQSIYKYLTWLHLLQQTEDFCQIQFGYNSQPEIILTKFNIEQDLKYGNFQCTELVLSHQITLYQIAGVRASRKINDFFKEKSAVGECLLKCINECKNAGNLNLAIRNITLLKNIETSKPLKAKALLEDADISTKNGKTKMAKEILRNLMLNSDFVFCLERIQAHRMYGEMLLETNNEAFDVVYKEFFLRSIELLSKYSEHRDKVIKSSSFDANEFEAYDKESRKLTFATIARYADKEYTQLNSYLHSETFHTKIQIMEKNKAEAQSLARQSKDRDKNIGINLMIRNCGIDDKEIKLMETKRSDNLCIAVENYIQFNKLDNAITSPAIYRIIALWFANKYDKKLQERIENIIDEIPSFKFICVLNQMSARLSYKNSTFLKTLERILVKCLEDHPHHTLYKILALVFAYADDPKCMSTHDRVKIAKDIINKATNAENHICIKQMESMFSALIDFANKDAGKNSSLNLVDKMKKLRDLDHVQCPTMDLPISMKKEYKLTYIRKWEENVQLVGGINAPKKLMCICSDGVTRPQLLKGKDDLRQDEVMQQVLSMVNELLQSDAETNDQNLSLRTYRIVPLSMRSGILEWCKNTMPLGLYLCGDKTIEGAHKKYRPNDYSITKCRNMAMEASKKRNMNDRLKTYRHICEKIKPVFHYFFFEKFLVPGIWFERRLGYTKSVATTSIVGFILGLGDRHVQNILIDELTAEVVHIDFGIAFEQGKIMPTPETVPFRLTRDIIAPMGISGADGVFRKACEKTMKILRKNNVFLTTILEVLLYDPLYVWTWSSQKSIESRYDNESSEEKNLTAQRALLRVQDKLEGKEEDKVGTSCVEVQVEKLINEAMNVHNLCRLYPGWDPYL